jgi:hypothetical protein
MRNMFASRSKGFATLGVGSNLLTSKGLLNSGDLCSHTASNRRREPTNGWAGQGGAKILLDLAAWYSYFIFQ